MSTANIYILRHATPERTDVPNRERPLSNRGRHQANALVPILEGLDLSAIYISPFAGTRQTVDPFARSASLSIVEREDIRESTNDEPIPDVSNRMLSAIHDIITSHPVENVLICTHGGCTWGVLYHFDSTFDYDDYKTIRTPDLFRVTVSDGDLSHDATYRLPDLA